MKRTLVFILVALMAISSIFATSANQAATDGVLNQSGVNSTADLELVVSEAQLARYAFGFTSDVGAGEWKTEDVAFTVPGALSNGKISLTYSSTTGSAKSNTAYFYYKIRSVSPLTLTLSCDEGLKGTNHGKTLEYKVSVDGADDAANSTGKSYSTDIALAQETPYLADDFAIIIETTTALTAKDEDTYTGALTLNIKAAGK